MVQPGSVILPKESSTSQGAVCPRTVEPTTPCSSCSLSCFQMSSVYTLYYILGRHRQAAACCSPICSCKRPQMYGYVRPWTSGTPGQWVPAGWWWAALAGSGQRPCCVSLDFLPCWFVWNTKLSFVTLYCYRGLKGLVAFLAEQPRQLKHLEWPAFQHTVCPFHWSSLRCLENCHDALLNIMWFGAHIRLVSIKTRKVQF